MQALTMLSAALVAVLCALAWELRHRSSNRAFTGSRRSVGLDGPEVLGASAWGLPRPASARSGGHSVVLDGPLALEVRIMPATHSWVGGAVVGGVVTNAWNVAANWNDNAIPLANDTVNFNAASLNDCVLPAGGAVVTVGAVNINPGYAFKLNLNGSTLAVVSLLNFSDPVGTIDGGGGAAGLGVLRVAGSTTKLASFNWSAGQLNELQLYVGQGPKQPPTGVLNWSGGTATYSILSFLTDSTVQATGAKLEADVCYLYNAGTFTDSGTISFMSGNELNIGEFDMDFGTLNYIAGAGPVAHFINGGTFQTVTHGLPPAIGSASTVSLTFDNQSSVVANANSPLTFRRSGVHTGSFNAVAGSTIAFDRSVIAGNGTNELTSTASLQGNGLYDVDDGATLQIDLNANIRVQNFRLEQNGNPLDISTLEIYGKFSAHAFDWNSGAIQQNLVPTVNGVLTIGQNDVLNMDDPIGTTGAFARTLDNVSINNSGTIWWREVPNSTGTLLMAPGDLNMMNQATIINGSSRFRVGNFRPAQP